MRNSSKKRLIKGFAALLFIGAAVALILLFTMDSQNEAVEQRGKQSENFGTYKRVSYNGSDYIEKSEITTILLLGVDKSNQDRHTGYRSGGQSDFMMLVVIDDKNKTIRELQINRDTMTDVTILSLLGQETGTRTMQLCLAHNFGKTEAENCYYTVKAIETLLGGKYIDFYISGGTDSIGNLNSALHGVEVTLPDDYTEYDAAMTKGSTLCLTNEQAEIMVRARYNIADGTNEMRMSRQRTFMDAAFSKLKQLARNDKTFISGFVNGLSSSIVSNVTLGRIINELSKAMNYSILPVEYLSGEYRMGSNGYREYYASEASITNWILNAYYRQI